MKNHLTTLALAAAAVLGVSAPAFAEHNEAHRWNHRTGDYKTSYDVGDQRQERPGFFSRIFGLPGRATRTALNSPRIAGESLTGRREIVSREGRFFARGDREWDGR